LFALPEPRVGLAALAGGIHRLPRQIGLKPAMGMLLTGRRVPADEAVRLGIANEVVPADQLMKAARGWAEQILECAPLSVRASKQGAVRGLEHASLADAMSASYDGIRAMYGSEDFIEGPKAFAEKRAPKWTGK
jgi:crotonobetainyl-CoA hydratase